MGWGSGSAVLPPQQEGPRRKVTDKGVRVRYLRDSGGRTNLLVPYFTLSSSPQEVRPLGTGQPDRGFTVGRDTRCSPLGASVPLKRRGPFTHPVRTGGPRGVVGMYTRVFLGLRNLPR